MPRWLIPLLICGCQEITEAEGDLRVLPGPTPDARPQVDQGTDAQRLEDAARSDALPPPDAAFVDVPGPPIDFGEEDVALPPDASEAIVDEECVVPWVTVADNPVAGCDGRGVTSLGVVPGPSTVAIARSGEGRVLIGHDVPVAADEGSYRLVVVSEDEIVVLLDSSIEPVDIFGESTGLASAMVAQRETFHLVTWRVTGVGNEILYRQLRVDGSLSEPELVTDAVGTFGNVDIDVSGNADVHVSWADKSSGEHALRTRSAADGWALPFVVDNDLEPRVPGRGATALVVDGRNLHVLYQVGLSVLGALPRSRTRVGAEWGARRTLDNNANDRLSGVSLDLALTQEGRAALYMDWVGGTGEVRLARWAGSDSPVEISTLLRGVVLPDAPGAFPLALSSDPHGLLHAVLHNPGRRTLEYHREVARDEWLVDVIDDTLPTEPSGIQLDLVVDHTRRPHVVYFNPESGAVHYASRIIDP